jgi:hypothetical protein
MEQILKFKTTPKKSGKYVYTDMEWDLSNQLDINEFLENNPDYKFVKAGKIVKSDNTPRFKIEVTPEWETKKFVLYLIVIFNKILKGGKSKNTLPERTYGSGTEEVWTINGECSPTNYVYSQIFRSCLEQGIDVDFYCFQAPIEEKEFDVFGETTTIEVSPYEEMEKILNKKLFKTLGKKPIGEGMLMEQYKN